MGPVDSSTGQSEGCAEKYLYDILSGSSQYSLITPVGQVVQAADR